MRKSSFLILLIMYSGITFGQTLIDTNKTWNIVKCQNFGGCWTESYKFEGDTTIDGTLYKKLWASMDSTLNNWYYYGAFREDTAGKGYMNDDSEEVLFYDFNLEAGDIFILQWGAINYTMTVEEVDSITLLNGEKRKRIIFDDYLDEVWIEGIGSTFGLPYVAYPVYWFDLGHELNCFYEDSELKYHHFIYDPCWYTTVGLEEKQTEQSWSVIPNPFETTCAIIPHDRMKSNNEVRILNIQGKQINTYQNIIGNIEIGSDLKKGFYIYQVIEKGILKQTGKLVKK